MTPELPPKHLARWAGIRQKGQLHFILVHGLLSWALPMFSVMTFFVNRSEISLRSVAISASVWTLGGILFGAAIWQISERKYRQLLATQPPAPPIG